MSNLIYYILLFNFYLTSSFVVVFKKECQIECKLFQFYPSSRSSLKIFIQPLYRLYLFGIPYPC